MSDVIVMEIELKGPMEPYQILLEPYAVVIPGEVNIHTTLRRQFKVDDALFFTPSSLLSLKFESQRHIFLPPLCLLSDVEPQQNLHQLSMGGK